MLLVSEKVDFLDLNKFSFFDLADFLLDLFLFISLTLPEISILALFLLVIMDVKFFDKLIKII